MKAFCLSCLLAVWPSYAGASAGPASGAYDWPASMKAALEGNFNLQALRQQYEAARQVESIRRSAYWPTLTASAYSTRWGKQFYAASGPSQSLGFSKLLGPELDWTDYDFGLQAGERLFSGFQDWGAAEVASDQSLQRQAAYDQASMSLRLSLRQNFNQLLYGQANRDLLKKIKARLSRHAAYLHIRYMAGQEARWAWLQAKADEKQVEWNLDQNELALSGQQASFVALMGLELPPQVPVTVTGDLEAPKPPSFEEAKPLLSAHPALRQQKAVVAANRAQLWTDQSSRWPMLSADASFFYRGESTSAWPPKDTLWSLGLNASYNLFAGGGEEAAIRETAANLMASQDSLSDQELSLGYQLYQAWTNYQATWERLPVNQLELDAANDQLRTTENLYQAGRKSFFEFEQAQSNLTSRLQAQLSGRLDLVQALAAYEKGLGLTLEDGEKP
jgi:outer membrane protein TolC